MKTAALVLVVVLLTACGLASAPAMPDATSASVLTVKVPLPAATRATAGSLVLHIEDLKLPPGSSGHVRVYADLSADAAKKLANTSTSSPELQPDPADPHYLGSFSIAPKNSAEAAQGIERKSVTVDVTDKAAQLSASANRSDVALTFIALRDPETASRDAAPAQPQIGRAYFAEK